MLLTLKQPAPQSYSHPSFHDYTYPYTSTPPTPPSSSRLSPLVAGLPPATHRLPPLPAPLSTDSMSTPHRGLPPPAAMTLPQPAQQPSQPSPITQPALSQSLGPLPAPPPQWQGADGPMTSWLLAKAEEDRRRQEEEKTKQESLRLEQRKIEQDMLRTSLSGGIPPHMVPMVFAGMGGGNLPSASLEWAQHYLSQTQQQQGHPPALLASQSYTPPEQLPRGDARRPYPGEHAVPVIPSTPAGSGSQQAGSVPGYQLSPTSSQVQAARQPQLSHLSRLSTTDMQAQTMGGQQGQAQPQESPPSIYFHHWQPPTTQTSSGAHQPRTPSAPSSPKKRKATGLQQAAPPPTSHPPPSNAPSRRRGHSRQRSQGQDVYGRPGSRQRHRYTESSFSVTSPVREQPERPRGYSNPISVSAILEYSDPRAPQPRLPQHDPRYEPGPDGRYEERRTPEEGSRRSSGVKRDDGRG